MRERIIQNAADHIERFGFKGFTMDDIAGQLGISKKTLYRHFRSKTELIEAAVVAWMEAEKQQTVENIATAGSWTERLIAAMDIYNRRQMPIRLLDEINRYYPEMNHLVLNLSAFKINQQRQVMLEARQAGELNEKLDIEVLLLIFNGVIFSLIQEASRRQLDYSLAVLMENAQQLLLHGILKSPAAVETTSTASMPGAPAKTDLKDKPGGHK